MSAIITRDELPQLADYTAQRDRLRTEVLAVKKARHVAIGENVSLLFENRLTVMYQIMEMLRIEKTTDAQAIQAELDAYNPLIPAGSDWRATMLIEFPDAEERQVQLKYLRQVEHHVYVEVDGERTVAFADEDMERSNEEKTSAVHFLRFALPSAAAAQLRAGASLRFGIDHPRYCYAHDIEDHSVRASLLGDLG